uniref:4-coumarate--CoA ligase 5 n=2 Tax=Hirondellea gigas TaxID=1518452 RepID=A0A2P2HWH1_9CRUS
MILSTLSRSLIGRSGVCSNIFKTNVIVNKSNVWFKQMHLSASVCTLKKPEHIYTSPHTDVQIPDMTLIDFLKDKSKDYDDRIATVCAETGEEMRYGELWAKVGSVASALVKLGIGLGSTVGLVSPNCPEFVICFLATAATGATITTVNSLYTPAEISRQLEDSGASAVIYHPTTAAVVLGATQMLPPGSVKHMISTHEAVNSGDLALLTLEADDGLAYPKNLQVDLASDVLVLPYSSGTTGVPKGVELTNRCIVCNLQQVSHPKVVFHNPDGVSVLFSVVPMFHIYGMVACLMLSILTGSKSVTFHKFDPQLFIKSMVQYKPTVMHLVPPILNFLVQSPKVLPEYMASMRTIVCGAASVGDVIVKQVHDKFGSGILFQEGFGMTELSPGAHLTIMGECTPGSCGPPLSNTMTKLVHVETKETLGPDDGPGEICIKGPQLMKGYRNNPEATAATIDADGWLYTGDIGRVDSDGNLFIIDRLKELIKVKGFQVAPAELENLLKDCPGVADSAVIGVKHDKLGEAPLAYIVKNPKHESITEEHIQKYIADRLSTHKHLAGGVVFLDAIPKGSTGKILRKELKQMAESDSSN